MKAFTTLAAFVAAVAVAVPAFAAAPQQQGLITDTLAPGGGKQSPYATRTVPAQTQGYRFITDTLAPGGGSNGGPTYVTAPHSPAFDWADAAIGASAGAGILLTLAGSLLVARRTRVAV